MEAREVIFAISARSAVSAARLDEPLALIESKILLAHPHDFGCDRDGVHSAS